MRNLIIRTTLLAILAVLSGYASANTITVELAVHGFNLSRFGAQTGTLTMAASVSSDSPNLVPESVEFSLYEAAYKVQFAGSEETTTGWLQLGNQQNLDALVFTVRFPNGYIGPSPFNTQVSGIQFIAYDPAGVMLPSASPFDIPANFADQIQTFFYALRIGGWEQNTGEWHEFTNDSLGSASFASNVTQVSTIPIVGPQILLASGLALMAALQIKRRASA